MSDRSKDNTLSCDARKAQFLEVHYWKNRALLCATCFDQKRAEVAHVLITQTSMSTEHAALSALRLIGFFPKSMREIENLLSALRNFGFQITRIGK